MDSKLARPDAMSARYQLYFHAPCFDGIVSAVLTSDFFEEGLGGAVDALHPVNYALRSSWMATDLGPNAAVVDFLYHPQAVFWADHHVSAFLTPESRWDFQLHAGERRVYDASATSCSILLWRHLERAFSYTNRRLTELVHWADKTDSAAYESVEEALFGTAPALRINFSLADADDSEYSSFLVRRLLRESLEKVARLPEVEQRYERYRLGLQRALQRFRDGAELQGDTVVFDVNVDDTPVPRYAPYYFFPNARYSVGIARSPEYAKISAMRNPWLEFRGIDLGREFARFGGGGHERVASVVLRGSERHGVGEVFRKLLLTLERTAPRVARVSGGLRR